MYACARRRLASEHAASPLVTLILLPAPAAAQPRRAGQNGLKFSPKGLAVAPLGGWGNLRHAANAAFMMVLHAKHAGDASSLAWAKAQVDYALGRWAGV